MRSQEQAEYQVEKNNPHQLNQIVRPSLLFRKRNLSSFSSQGALRVSHYGKRYLYLQRGTIPAGASQKFIAAKSGISRATAQRYLSNEYRIERGLPPILKRQQAVEADPAIQVEIEEGNGNDVNVGKEHYFTSAGKAWNSKPNIYYSRLNLSSNKTARYFYKKWLERNPLPVEGSN